MERVFKDVKLTDFEIISDALISHFDTSKVILFYGHMGAGKTTFIHHLCNVLQVLDDVSSPTYSIVNEYLTQTDETIYHFDFYRLKSEIEAYDLGYEDYLYSGNLCLIEWPEKIASLLPDEVIEFHINGIGDNREIKLVW
jgi:tRNA threonylcarbamoyladenosine biosynthesis protein TsaE